MKIMVVHPGTQHSTKLTFALKNKGYDVVLVTTVYNKTGSLINKISKLLPANEQNRLSARMNPQLNDKDIILFSELSGLILLLLARIDKSKKVYVKFKRFVAKRVGVKAAKLAIRKKYDAMIVFDSYAKYPFEYLQEKKSNIKRVIDCTAAYAPEAKKVYSDVLKNYPELEFSLKSERCVIWNDKYYRDMVDEAYIADYVICASTYTKNTFCINGIKEDKLHVIPYGYDSGGASKTKVKKNVFNVLFVGGVNVMKGIPTLIQAFSELPYKDMRLTLIGNTQSVIKNMINDERIVIKGFMPHNQLYNEYESANLFVFPSLSDGFGFAPLEAMSHGVPCIVTNTSGISDIIEDTIDGFVINPNSSNELKKTIEYAYINRKMLEEMRTKAKIKALLYDENRYEECIDNFVKQILFCKV